MAIEAFAQTAQDLRGDDTGISACTHERAGGDGTTLVGIRSADRQRGKVFHDHGKRERHVRSRIAIRHGENVQSIDLILACIQSFCSSSDGVCHIIGTVITHSNDSSCERFSFERIALTNFDSLYVHIDSLERGLNEFFKCEGNLIDEIGRYDIDIDPMLENDIETDEHPIFVH